MATVKQIEKAILAVDDLCGKCPICSLDCPIAIAKRALSGFKYDMEEYERSLSEENNYK